MSWITRLKMRQAIDVLPTKTTETVFVVSVGTVNSYVEKLTDAANDTIRDLDRYCWPNSTAMNSQEIKNFKARLDKFTLKGLDLDAAEKLADQLLNRDRDGEDRCLCFECRHLSRYAGSWRCGNWKAAGIAHRSMDAKLPVAVVLILQRCNGWQS
jgi:hypothetical protein